MKVKFINKISNVDFERILQHYIDEIEEKGGKIIDLKYAYDSNNFCIIMYKEKTQVRTDKINNILKEK